MFQRSSECHADILAEKQRRRKAKEEKAERLRLEEQAKKEKDEERKKRKLKERMARTLADVDQVAESPSRHSSRSVEDTPNKTSPSAKRKITVVELDDSDDDRPLTPSGRTDRLDTPTALSSSSQPPKRRLTGDGHSVAAATEPRLDEVQRPQDTNKDTSGVLADGETATASVGDADAKPKGPNPALHILIDTRIPNTKPLVVKRNYLDNVRPIRKIWCEKQAFTYEQTKNVILTWRGKRVYDFCDFHSLGIELNHRGEPVLKVGSEGYHADGDKIVFVATTMDIFEEDKKAAEEAVRRKLEGREEEEEREEEKKAVRLVLRAKGKEDVKMAVQPVCFLLLRITTVTNHRQNTTFARIARAYKSKVGLGEDVQIALTFDGEQLEPDMPVQESELEDKDSIEVNIK
jgi:hypothetical protein